MQLEQAVVRHRLGMDMVLAERADQHGADHGRLLTEEAVTEPVDGAGAEVCGDEPEERGRHKEGPRAAVLQRAVSASCQRD